MTQQELPSDHPSFLFRLTVYGIAVGIPNLQKITIVKPEF
jgi:hypothetical protein